MNDKQQEMWDLLCELGSETVLNLLTDWHGLQLLDDGFYGHLIDEGYIDEPKEEISDAELNREREEAVQDEDFLRFCATFETCWMCPVYRRGLECGDYFSELLGTAEGRATLKGERITDDE